MSDLFYLTDLINLNVQNCCTLRESYNLRRWNIIDIAQCSVVEVDQRFGAHSIHHQGDERFIPSTMKAARSSETSVKFCETLPSNVPESCHLFSRHLENLKS
jgi:hypothetical protein